VQIFEYFGSVEQATRWIRTRITVELGTCLDKLITLKSSVWDVMVEGIWFICWICALISNSSASIRLSDPRSKTWYGDGMCYPQAKGWCLPQRQSSFEPHPSTHWSTSRGVP